MKKFVVWSAGLLVLAGGAGAMAQEKVDFQKQIQPILAKTCYECHGAEKQKAKLALHTAELFAKGSKEGPVIVPGDPAKSTLYARVILPRDHEDVMPPEDEGEPLTKEQTDLLAQWITEGASFGEWKGDAGAVAEGSSELPLPEVAAADGAAVEKLRGHGALVLPLAQGINLLDVSFLSSADQVDDAKLADLAPIAQQVYSLNLANTKVTDAGLAQVAALPNLRVLHLEKTSIGDAGLAHLKSLQNLQYLNLYGTQVTDAGLANLEGLKNLKNVYLWQSQVTDAGADKLRAALPECKVDTGWKEPAPAAAATPAPEAAPAAAPDPAAPAAEPAPAAPAAEPAPAAPAAEAAPAADAPAQ